MVNIYKKLKDSRNVRQTNNGFLGKETQRHARQSTSVVGDMCPTICKPVHTHAQWRFVFVFAADEA